MMTGVIPLTEKIYWLGVNDYETELFEAIWPLPDGISYNSYLIADDKVALIDTVKKGFIPAFLDKINKVLAPGRKIDYLVINHIEPDHSGAIDILKELFPDMQIVGNQTTADFLKALYGIEQNVKIVQDNDVLDLGSHKLKFFKTPMVHWPETMMTYETSQKVLFSGDVFGGFGALPGGIFDDQVDLAFFEKETLRYFSNIIGKYSAMAQKTIGRLKGLDIRMVASTHGPIFRKNPNHIISRYDRWSRHETENGAVVVYASMYGNTQKLSDAVTSALALEGVNPIRVFNISRTHISFIISELWRYKALILGSPTYNTRLFPLMEHLVNVLENDQITNHVLGIFGSFGWSGGGVSALKEFAQKGKWDLVEPVVEVKFAPTDKDLENCGVLAKNIARKLLTS